MLEGGEAGRNIIGVVLTPKTTPSLAAPVLFGVRTGDEIVITLAVAAIFLLHIHIHAVQTSVYPCFH
jgi:hypothetical protein